MFYLHAIYYQIKLKNQPKKENQCANCSSDAICIANLM